MSEDVSQQRVTIINELGLHARAASQFVQLAASYPCEVFVAKGEHEVNGKSIMGVLMLVAAKGTEITIRARGEGAAEVVAKLVELVNNRFGEGK